MTKRIGIALVLLQILLPLRAKAEPAAAACSLCTGQMVSLTAGDPGICAAEIPLLAVVDEADLSAAATAIDACTPERRRDLTIVVSYRLDPAADPLLEIEQHTRTILDWTRAHGPFDGLGIRVAGATAEQTAYAIKRLAVSAQGLDVAKRIVAERGDDPAVLFESGAAPYFDALVVAAPDVERTMAFLAEHDPSKKIFAVAPITSPNPLFDLGAALAQGATRAYAEAGSNAAPQALQQFNRVMTGDWAADTTARVPVLDAKGAAVEMPVLSFVRGEDLRTVLIARGDAASSSILSLSADQYTRPRRVDSAGERDITDTGRRGNRFLVGTPPAREPFAVLVDRAEKPDSSVTKETISVATARGITVEEIIRNHQAYSAFQESIRPRYVAKNTTKLRFDIGGGADSLEATIAGDYFADLKGRADWVWSDFLINGVKWKYGRIPELPLIQPEKVTQLPLDLHLTNDYRYELVRETDILGYHTYEVRFAPPPNAPPELPLYRGTVWIDAKSWARVRISTVQLNLGGEVLSNEERVDFLPFSRQTSTPLTATDAEKSDPRSLLWLVGDVSAQQVISAAGRASVVQRATTFSNFRIDPPDFATLLAQVSASDVRMVRETPTAGLRYLEKKSDGTRAVKEGYDTSQLFLLGGVHHDAGLEYPVVPLGGVDYFNFNLGGRGIQTNVFFAGVILAANVTNPDFRKTRTNIGADFFGIAVPVSNTIYRNGEERPDEEIRTLPVGLYLRAGHPLMQFGKIDLSLGFSHASYRRADKTADSFTIPTNTFVITPGIEAKYARRGYTASAYYDYNKRTEWNAWGDPAEYSADQKTFTHFGGSLGKSFYLPSFQRIGIDVSYLDGQRLDRFSKYELGFFGSQRVHGIQSGSVRAEKAVLGHLSYGFVFSQQIRLEAFYDHAVLDDAAAGYRREPFQGVGIAGQTIGPFGTLLRLDIGKSIGRNAQDGFVANVVFLKLF